MKTTFEILNVKLCRILCFLSCARFAFGINGCERPPLPLGGGNFTPDKEFYEVNEVARYRCDTNSKYIYLFGNSTRVCLENGTWSGSLPYCAQPSATKIFRKGVLLRNQKVLNDRNENTCLYVNENSSLITFMFQQPVKCKQLVLQIVSNRETENFRVKNLDYGFNDHALTMHESRNITDGQLFFHLYTYERSTLRRYSHFGILVNDYKNGNYCKICDIDLFADIVSSCPWIPNPNWVTFITYDNLPRTSCSYFDYGNAAIFNCRQGYYLKGNKIRYCAENNTWTGSNPSCEETYRNDYSMVLFCAGIGLGIFLTMAVVIFLLKKQKKRTIEERDEVHGDLDCDEKYLIQN